MHPVAQLQLERTSCVPLFVVPIYNSGVKMMVHISEVVTQYEEHVWRMQKVPRFSYGRRMVRADGVPNRLLFYTLFNDHAMAIEFLKEISASPQSGMDHSYCDHL